MDGMIGVSIDIYLTTDGKTCQKFAYRRWLHVPRVGEFVELRSPDTGEEFRLAEVLRLHWGEEKGIGQSVAMFVRWKS